MPKLQAQVFIALRPTIIAMNGSGNWEEVRTEEIQIHATYADGKVKILPGKLYIRVIGYALGKELTLKAIDLHEDFAVLEIFQDFEDPGPIRVAAVFKYDAFWDLQEIKKLIKTGRFDSADALYKAVLEKYAQKTPVAYLYGSDIDLKAILSANTSTAE